MVDTPTVNIQANGYRNAVINLSLVSDGSGLAAYKVYDAASTGVYGVTKAGQVFYPGVHSTLVGLKFDVDGMRAQLLWEATANALLMAIGGSPGNSDWKDIGGIRVPAGLAGATGSILVSTIAPAANATMFMTLYIRKNVP